MTVALKPTSHRRVGSDVRSELHVLETVPSQLQSIEEELRDVQGRMEELTRLRDRLQLMLDAAQAVAAARNTPTRGGLEVVG